MSVSENENDLISVIVPSYNNAETIEDCIKSIVNQTYNNIEVVVVDDASADSSIDIVENLKKKYNNIRIVRNDSNHGVARSRNIGITAATGSYISTLDADDYYCFKDKLMSEYSLIKKKSSEGIDIIAYSDIEIVNDEKKHIFYKSKKEKIKEGYLMYEFITRSCFIPRDFMVNKFAYEVCGVYNSSIPIYEDWDLKIRLSKHYQFYYTGKPGVSYRQHDAGLSSTGSCRHIYWLHYVFWNNINSLKNRKIDAFKVFYAYLCKKYFFKFIMSLFK